MNTMLGFLKKLRESALDFLFPQNASVRELEMLAQSDQLSTLPPPTDSFPDSITSLFSYKDTRVRELVWQIKYKRNPKLLKAVSKLFYETILADISDKKFFSNDVTFIIPIPMSKKRRKERGYNQCEEVVRSILTHDNEKILFSDFNTLIKIGETISQTKTKNKKERLENMRGAFAVSGHQKIIGRHIILIDDVVTTGGTITEAKRALKETGVKNISAYTIAH